LATCPCENGCPSCVGPASEYGEGGKTETLYLLSLILGKNG
jgi:DEAD/DEAH box helicase domain-containing protein